MIYILLFTLVAITVMMVKIKEININNKFRKPFLYIGVTFCIHLVGLILQVLLKDSRMSAIYFDYITYTGGVFTPICFVSIGLIYINKDIDLMKYKNVLIIPIIFLAFLYTNDFHHLFYRQYSIYLDKTEFGPVLYLYAFYSYSLIILSMIMLIVNTIKRSGFFSVQTMLIISGILIPLITNFLGFLKIISMTIYLTPICFIFTALCFSLAIFKYKALNITPVSFRTIIDTMSDAYIAISDDGTVVDRNKTFDNMFTRALSLKKNDNLFEWITSHDFIDLKKLREAINEAKNKKKLISKEYKISYEEVDRYFDVDIHPIKAVRGEAYVGTLLLFKDITQHKEDIQTIQAKQEIIVKQGQLVSIGELAGSVAHDINTPISAIKTGISMLTENQDNKTDIEKELLDRMNNCADKIIAIVNSMRNQIRNLGSNEKVKFKLSDVINDIKTIIYNEVRKKGCILEIDIKDDLSVNGVPTKLGQVFTNLIMNAIQAYDKKGGKIQVDVRKAPNNKVLVTIRDYAGGLPDKIKKSAFKEILTTKGSAGTGLGLYLVYSVIKGEFGGDITLESEDGKGTTFYIVLDRA